MYLVGTLDTHDGHNARNDFLYHKNGHGKPHELEAEKQTDKYRKLGQFVRNGIKYFTYVAYHVEFSRDKSVNDIRKARHCEDDGGNNVFVLYAIQPYKDRDVNAF